MNFLKNQLIQIRFERKVKLFIKVVELKFKQLILMEMKYLIMLVQIAIQVFSKNLSLILNINEEKENKWLWFKFKFIILVSIVLFVLLIFLFSFCLNKKKIHLTLLKILKHTFSRHSHHDKYQGTSTINKHLSSRDVSIF